MANSTFCFEKKLGMFNAKGIRKKIEKLYESSMQLSDSNTNSGHFMLTKCGLLCWENYGTPSEVLKNTANEIFEMVSK